MKKLIILALAAGALVVPATADAAGIRECGNLPHDSIRNITTRHMDCRTAKWFAVDWTRVGRQAIRYYRFGNMRQTVREYTKQGCCTTQDVRISNGRNVLHFQYEIDW